MNKKINETFIKRFNISDFTTKLTIQTIKITKITTASTLTTTIDKTFDSFKLNEKCQDIKTFLWQNTSDLTSIRWTMSIFAVIYSLIIM